MFKYETTTKEYKCCDEKVGRRKNNKGNEVLNS